MNTQPWVMKTHERRTPLSEHFHRRRQTRESSPVPQRHMSEFEVRATIPRLSPQWTAATVHNMQQPKERQLTSSRAINDGDSQIRRSMPRTVDRVYPLTRRAIPVCNRLTVARTDFRYAALKPYLLEMPPHNCETRQASIIVFPNPQRKERRFLPGQKARISAPNI
jgi:hypothetical protein